MSAKQHLGIATGEACSYGGRFMYPKNNHGSQKIHARVEISAPGMNTVNETFDIYPNEKANKGCSRASPSQKKKFKVTFAEFS